MATHVALLRGVNVGGTTVGMAPLRSGFEALGLAEVRTYLQSGNVVFAVEGGDPSVLAAVIRARVAADFGHEVGVLVLTSREVVDVAHGNPFVAGDEAVDERHLHVTFLFERPSENEFVQLDLPAAEGERAVLAGRVVYLHLPSGYGRTKLTNAFFERKLGMRATTRDWRTVLALAGMVTAR